MKRGSEQSAVSEARHRAAAKSRWLERRLDPGAGDRQPIVLLEAHAIVDGIVATEGNRPVSGEPVQIGAWLEGDDPVSTDVIAAQVMGFEPEDLAYLSEAARFPRQGIAVVSPCRGEDPSRLETALVPAPVFEEPPPGDR